MRSPQKPKSYVITPFTMALPGIPLLAEGSLPDARAEEGEQFKGPGEIPVRGLSTLSTQPESARRDAEELLRHCQNRVRMGDRSAILELLDHNPAFIRVPWVRETLVRLVDGGLPLRKRGRPHARYRVHPLVVVGLVEVLISSGRAENREQAFAKLEGLGVLRYESAKDSYYRALRETRFRPVLIEFPEFAREISAEEAAQLPTGERLQPGREISRTWENTRLGNVTLTLKGE